MRQKAQKLMSEVPRHDLKPSQYLTQLVEDTKDVSIDDIRKEHLLKTIPARYREIMGKEVEAMTAAEVAKMADDFFDRQGKPLEKTTTPVNSVASTAHSPLPQPPSTSSASSFTSAFSDDETDVNFVKRNNFRGNDRGRNHNRNQRSQSRPSFNRVPNTSSNGSDSQPSHPQGTCRWHRQFGDKSRKCVTDCPRYKAFVASQKSGNGQGGRRQ